MMTNEAAARAALYRLLALALGYPAREFLDAVASGEYQCAVERSAGSAGVAIIEMLPGCPDAGEHLEAAYLQLFEVGRNRDKPCALREGANVDFEFDDVGGAHADMPPNLSEDLLRFYHYFGMRLSDDPAQKLPPDHIVCQLEMLSHLSLLESTRQQDAGIVSGYRNAQRDFIHRHVIAWLPKVQRRLHELEDRSEAVRFYTAVADAAVAGVNGHLAHIS